MDPTAKTILYRTLKQIPKPRIEEVLEKWKCLSAEQLRSLDHDLPRSETHSRVREYCEENNLGLKQITHLEMIWHMENPDQGTWRTFQLLQPQGDALRVELTQFQQKFKTHLQGLVRNVSVKIKKHEDEALWIRVAWGENLRKPNHLKPTYVVHYLHTSYVFSSGLADKHKSFLQQALVVATDYSSMKDAHLSSRKLTGLKQLLLKHHQQVFQSSPSRILQERHDLPTNPLISAEHADHRKRRYQAACDAYGHGPLPQLERAEYRLETVFRGSETSAGQQVFRGMVRFSSSSLLESLRSCADAGMTEGPVTPLLAAITQRKRNYFVITDKS